MVVTEINPDNLIDQLQQGNESAFSALYDMYSKPLYRNLLCLVKDEDVAQELLQDLFMKIWEIRERIEPEKSFKSFLYKIAENLAYSHFRQIAKNERLIAKLIISSVEFVTNAEDAIIVKENHALLQRAISSLSPQAKQVYTLCKLEGKSYEEVSHQLGISPKTISAHIVKANKDVRRFFLHNSEPAVVFVVINLLAHAK